MASLRFRLASRLSPARPARRGPRPRPRAARGPVAPLALALLGALGPGACLPDDTRPPPGVVTVWLEGAEGLEARTPVATDDGWAITFERVISATAGPRPYFSGDDSGCDLYYESAPGALYDVVVPGGPRLVGRLAGLGACGFDVAWGFFANEPPDLVGPGLTPGDVASALARLDPSRPGGGYSEPNAMFVAGVAERGGARKSFAWAVPGQTFSLGCDGFAAPLRAELASDAALDVRITLRPERLFFDRLEGALGRPRFDAVAGADADGDGDVTGRELAAVRLAALAGGDAYALPWWRGDAPDDGEGEAGPTLLDFVNEQARHVAHHGERSLCDLSASTSGRP